MASDLEHADDVSAMMEALWGPRAEVPAHLARGLGSRSYADGAGDGPDDVEPATVEQIGSPSPEARGSERSGDALRRQLDDLRSEFAAAVAAIDGRLSARIDAVAETVQPGVGPVVPPAEGDFHQELALIESWERESAERLAALEQAVGSELERLSLTVEASHNGLAATADLDVLRGEVADRLAASLSDVEGRMVTRAGLAQLRAEVRAEMVEQLRRVFDEALKQGDARAAAVAAELSRRQEALVGKDEFAVLRSDLRALQEQVQQISTVVAALQRGSLGS